MDSIDDGATIRIGFQETNVNYGNNVHTISTPTYSLKINKKTSFIWKGGKRDEYMRIFENAAKDVAKKMNAKCVKKYEIYNGERVRMSNYKWESCGYIPNNGEEIFKKTLEAHLK